MTASLEIELKDYTVKDVQLPDYLVEMTSDSDYFVEVKRNLLDVFSTFFNSDEFKERDDTTGFMMLHQSLNGMLDNLFMGHYNGRMNHMKEQIDKIEHL